MAPARRDAVPLGLRNRRVEQRLQPCEQGVHCRCVGDPHDAVGKGAVVVPIHDQVGVDRRVAVTDAPIDAFDLRLGSNDRLQALDCVGSPLQGVPGASRTWISNWLRSAGGKNCCPSVGSSAKPSSAGSAVRPKARMGRRSAALIRAVKIRSARVLVSLVVSQPSRPDRWRCRRSGRSSPGRQRPAGPWW